MWTFTTCGKSGRLGPSQLLCNGFYKNENLNKLVDVTQGIQQWIVPVDGEKCLQTCYTLV